MTSNNVIAGETIHPDDVTIGVDIGGTTTSVGVVDSNGKRLYMTRFPTRGQESAQQFLPRLAQVIRNLLNELHPVRQLQGIGIASPAANWRAGTVEHPANLNWGTVNIVEMMRSFFPVPVVVANDCDAAVFGEMQYGAAKGMKNFIMISMGTGLGGGIVIDGKLFQGEHGAAAEFGHITIDAEGRVCGCGRRGCVETYVSASGLRRTVAELLARQTDSSALRGMSFDEITAEEVYNLARSDDRIATRAFALTGEYLGRMLSNIVATLDPQAVVLYGGLVNAGDLLAEPTRRSFEENALHRYRGQVDILISALNNGEAAILGASSLVRETFVAKAV